MELLATRDSWWMTQCEALLAAEGISRRWLEPWQASGRGTMMLDVPASESERAVDLLSEQLGEELGSRRRPPSASEAWVPLFLQPDFAFALSFALLFVFWFWVTGGAGAGTELFARGAMLSRAAADGEWWRFVTAATLHADLEHVLSNAGFMLVLGWAASERFGAGVASALWLATAVAGFVTSLLLSDAAVTVGASGGLFGLLGAAGGHGVRRRGRGEVSWRERVRVVGAAVLLLAFTAFSPEANIPAHLGGFVAGVALGVLASPWKRLFSFIFRLYPRSRRGVKFLSGASLRDETSPQSHVSAFFF